MKISLSFLLSCFVLTSFCQTTTTTFSTYNTNPSGGAYDFAYAPFRGYSTWQGNCGGCSPMPSGTNVTARDRYYRWPVTDILDYNASSVQFNWTNSNSSDACFDCEMNAAIDAGGKLSIDVQFQCGFCGGHGTNIADAAQGGRTGYLIYPKAWHNAMQADAVKDFTWSNHGTYEWFPNLNGATFQNFWKQLHQGILDHLNNTSYVSAKTGLTVKYKDAVNYIVVSGYGQTGEWTNTPYSGASGSDGVWPGPSGSEPTVAALDSIISTVAQIYKNYYVVNQIGTFDGNQLSQNTHIPAAVGWFALNGVSTNKGPLGMRDDGIGNHSPYVYSWTRSNPTTFVVPSGFPGAGTTYHFDTAIQNRWKFSPFVGEPCCPAFTSGATDNDYTQMVNFVQTFHINAVDNGNNFNGGIPGDAAFKTNWQSAEAASGYKMVLTQVVSTTAITSGTAFNITPTWNNIGVAPPYWDWTVVWELKTKPGDTPAWTDSSTFNMLGFLPGTATAFSQNYTKAIAAGTYGLYVTVKDPRRYYDPMPLYITATQNAEGSYFIRNITVSSSGVPVANAGPNQTITLPTSSVTLDGSGSTGTITSLTWSQVSGPNTASIVSPNASTTLVTGLIQGAYGFQLALNGGSTSTVTITVNPALPSAASIFSTQTPVATTANDYPSQTSIQGVEDGVRFTSSIPGYITGIRFYKTANNNGTHIGELYTNTGTRLAAATFTSETGSGWQTVKFNTPVAITANTTYVAAYWSSLGNYVEDNDYFLRNSVVNRQLTAPADGLNGASANPDATNTTNGPWIYTTAPAFPNNAFRSANYWVDVIFSTTASTSGQLIYIGKLYIK